MFAVMLWFNQVLAQCDVSNVVISEVRPVQNGTGVDYTIDISFTAEENNGAKFTWLHLWLEKDYKFSLWHNGFNATYPCPRSNNSSRSAPTTTAAGFDMLDQSFLTFGFELGSVGITAGKAGIMTSYIYDATIIPGYANAVIYKQSLGGKFYRITIQNVSFHKANCTVTDYLEVRAFNWATNANTAGGTPVQCYSCENSPFVIGDPRISGNVNCVYPRTYNLFIDSRYLNASTPGVDVIYGSYTLYADVNRSGKIELAGASPDILVKAETTFTTDPAPVGGVPAGFQSRFMQLNGIFDYEFGMGDTNSNKNIIALVNIETPGYTGADVAGLLANNCTVLPVTLSGFSVSQFLNSVQLNWKTEQEFDLSGFEIQRNLNHAGYKSIGFVAAMAKDGNGAIYNYTDKDIAKGVVIFYRLRIIDQNGEYSYSDIRVIRNNAVKMNVSIYPNPSNGRFSIAVPADAGLYDVMLTDVTGRVLLLKNSQRNQSIQIQRFYPGCYLLKIWFRETGETITEKVVVQ